MTTTNGAVEAAVVNGGATSARIEPRLSALFRYLGTPGTVSDLAAAAVSATEVELTFSAPSDSDEKDGSPSAHYIVKQSDTSITGAAGFEEGRTLCGKVCVFTPSRIGEQLELSVTDLAPGTYHYAVWAVNEAGVVGNRSNEAVVTLDEASRCAAVNAPGPGQASYAGGRYSLVGAPSGTVLGAGGPLYSWFDQGAGASYEVVGASAPLVGGRGYWAWFSCPRLVQLSDAGQSSTTISLGGYHASMVGNPTSTGAATLSGHDFAALWDPGANEGAGGYIISGYSEPQSLEIGQGTWAFAYTDTILRIAQE